MQISPYATPDDVTAIFGSVTDQTAKVDKLLDFAAALLRTRVPQLQARLDAGTLDDVVVVSVVTAMVVRVLRNPLGYRQGSQTIDDYSTSWTVDQAVSSGALYVSDIEVADLAPPTAGLRVGTLRLGTWL